MTTPPHAKLLCTPDVTAYRQSLSATLDLLPANSRMIRGVTDTVRRLREEFGLKIGSSTGYTSEIMAKLKVTELKFFWTCCYRRLEPNYTNCIPASCGSRRLRSG